MAPDSSSPPRPPSASSGLGFCSTGWKEVRLTGNCTTYLGSLLDSLGGFTKDCAKLNTSSSSMEEVRDEGKQYYLQKSAIPEGWYQAHHTRGGVILRCGNDNDISYLSGIVEQKKPRGFYRRDDLWDLPDGIDKSRGAAWTKVASTFRTASLSFDDGGGDASKFYIVHDENKAATFHVRGGAIERADMSTRLAHDWAVDTVSKNPGNVVISTYDLSEKEPE